MLGKVLGVVAGLALGAAVTTAGVANASALPAAAPHWHIVKSVKTGLTGDFTAVVATRKTTGWAFDGYAASSGPAAWDRRLHVGEGRVPREEQRVRRLRGRDVAVGRVGVHRQYLRHRVAGAAVERAQVVGGEGVHRRSAGPRSLPATTSGCSAGRLPPGCPPGWGCGTTTAAHGRRRVRTSTVAAVGATTWRSRKRASS